jgi:hypothetical protein
MQYLGVYDNIIVKLLLIMKTWTFQLVPDKYDLKVCDDCTLDRILYFLTLSIVLCVLDKNRTMDNVKKIIISFR